MFIGTLRCTDAYSVANFQNVPAFSQFSFSLLLFSICILSCGLSTRFLIKTNISSSLSLFLKYIVSIFSKILTWIIGGQKDTFAPPTQLLGGGRVPRLPPKSTPML